MKLSERLAQLFSKEDRLTPHVIYAQLTEAAAIEIVAEAQRLEKLVGEEIRCWHCGAMNDPVEQLTS